MHAILGPSNVTCYDNKGLDTPNFPKSWSLVILVFPFRGGMHSGNIEIGLIPSTLTSSTPWYSCSSKSTTFSGCLSLVTSHWDRLILFFFHGWFLFFHGRLIIFFHGLFRPRRPWLRGHNRCSFHTRFFGTWCVRHDCFGTDGFNEVWSGHLLNESLSGYCRIVRKQGAHQNFFPKCSIHMSQIEKCSNNS